MVFCILYFIKFSSLIILHATPLFIRNSRVQKVSLSFTNWYFYKFLNIFNEIHCISYHIRSGKIEWQQVLYIFLFEDEIHCMGHLVWFITLIQHAQNLCFLIPFFDKKNMDSVLYLKSNNFWFYYKFLLFFKL